MQGRGIVSIPPILIIQVNSAISSSMTSVVEHNDVQLTDFRFHASLINQSIRDMKKLDLICELRIDFSNYCAVT